MTFRKDSIIYEKSKPYNNSKGPVLNFYKLLGPVLNFYKLLGPVLNRF